MMRWIFLILLPLVACNQTSPVEPPADEPTPVDGWYPSIVRGYAHSRWLDFISITTDNSTVPIELRRDGNGKLILPDTVRVVNHSDRDTAYHSTQVDTTKGFFYIKFEFPDGYTDKWQPTTTLSLSVCLKY